MADEKKPERPRREMSRREQTIYILGAMGILGAIGFNYMATHDASNPYAECASIFNSDPGCKARVAMERMNR